MSINNFLFRRLESSFHSNMYRHALLQLMSAYSTFLETSSSSHCGDLVASKEEETKISDMVPGLARFGILAMEYVKWMLTSNTEVIGPLDHQVGCVANVR